jgi:hypothetical protein
LKLVSELEALLADHSYRERRWGQLMLALYRSDRQADALQAFHRARQGPGRGAGHRAEPLAAPAPGADPAPGPSPGGARPDAATSATAPPPGPAHQVRRPPPRARRASGAAASPPPGLCDRAARVGQDPPGRGGGRLLAGGLPARRLVRVAGRGRRSRAGPVRCGHRPGGSGAARAAGCPGAHRPLAVKAAAAGAGQLRTCPAGGGGGSAAAGCRPGASGAGDQPDAAAAVRRAGVSARSSAPAPARGAGRRPPVAVPLGGTGPQAQPRRPPAHRRGRSTTPPGSGPCGTRSPGATSCSAPPTEGCCGAWGSSRAASPWRPPRRSPRAHPGSTSWPPSPLWSRGACWGGRWSPARRASGCWRRSASTPWSSCGRPGRTMRSAAATPASTRHCRPWRPLLLAGRLGRGRGRLRPRPGAGQGPGGLVAGVGGLVRGGLHAGLPAARMPGGRRGAGRSGRCGPRPGSAGAGGGGPRTARTSGRPGRGRRPTS